MANIWEKAILILAGNLNLGLSYLITTVQSSLWFELLHIVQIIIHISDWRFFKLLSLQNVFLVLLLHNAYHFSSFSNYKLWESYPKVRQNQLFCIFYNFYVTSDSKQLTLNAVLYHYCFECQFFWIRRI